MSELISSNNERLDKLYEFACRLTDGDDGKALVREYRQYTDTVTAEETMRVIDHLLIKGYPTGVVKKNVGKIINVFHESLRSQKWDSPGEGHFLYYLMLENRRVENIMSDIRSVVKSIFSSRTRNYQSHFMVLKKLITVLKEYDLHYIKKENILFPYIEKTFPQYRCLQIMWSFHDDFRKAVRKIEDIISGTADLQMLNRELGRLFFVVFPIIFREEKIVFPVAYKAIPEKSWSEMLTGSTEIGWCYDIKPRLPEETVAEGTDHVLFDLGTGRLSPEQVTLMLDTIPVDITYVDENDEVVYFSGSLHRVFPRSKGIIGRKVQNCHPPESVHIVNEIIDVFRNGSKDHADFWIKMKGRFIHIRYFALRNAKREYKGVIEVSQDVTEIRNLEGEKRLLDWNK